MSSLNTGANGTHGFHESEQKDSRFSKYACVENLTAAASSSGKHAAPGTPGMFNTSTARKVTPSKISKPKGSRIHYEDIPAS